MKRFNMNVHVSRLASIGEGFLLLCSAQQSEETRGEVPCLPSKGVGNDYRDGCGYIENLFANTVMIVLSYMQNM